MGKQSRRRTGGTTRRVDSCGNPKCPGNCGILPALMPDELEARRQLAASQLGNEKNAAQSATCGHAPTMLMMKTTEVARCDGRSDVPRVRSTLGCDPPNYEYFELKSNCVVLQWIHDSDRNGTFVCLQPWWYTGWNIEGHWVLMAVIKAESIDDAKIFIQQCYSRPCAVSGGAVDCKSTTEPQNDNKASSSVNKTKDKDSIQVTTVPTASESSVATDKPPAQVTPSTIISVVMADLHPKNSRYWPFNERFRYAPWMKLDFMT